MPKDSSILIFLLTSFILSSYLAYICYPKYDPKTALFAGNLSYELKQTIQSFVLLVVEFVTLNMLGYGYEQTYRSLAEKIIDGATKELDHKNHNITVRELSFSDNKNYQVIQAIPNEFLQTSTPRPTLFYFHGGGMLFGKPHLITIATAINLRVQVFGVKYRLAPEHKFPAGLDDCSDAIRRILRDYPNKFNVGKFGLFGVSAGGYLAIAAGMDIDFESDPLIIAAGRKKKNLPNKPEKHDMIKNLLTEKINEITEQQQNHMHKIIIRLKQVILKRKKFLLNILCSLFYGLFFYIINPSLRSVYLLKLF